MFVKRAKSSGTATLVMAEAVLIKEAAPADVTPVRHLFWLEEQQMKRQQICSCCPHLSRACVAKGSLSSRICPDRFLC